MKHAAWMLLLLSACPSARNPPQVWLTLNGSELMVRLTPIEPVPF